MTPDAAAVIVNYNCGAVLVDCIESLRSHSSRALEIVVVDNASTDDSLAEVRARCADAKIVRNERNVGLAGANNIGIESTTAPIVVMCNPDIRCKNDIVDELLGCFARHPRAALVGARQYDDHGRVRSTVAAVPRLRDAVRGRYWWSWWPHDNEQQVGQVNEACYAVRREAIASVGGLDPGYFLYWEGADWAYRFAEAGWETWFCPTAEVVHSGGVTVGSLPFRRIVWSHRGAYRFFRLHSRVPKTLLGVIFTVRALVKMAVERVRPGDAQVPVVRVR